MMSGPIDSGRPPLRRYRDWEHQAQARKEPQGP
jgi:hypothetical protein